MFLPFFVFFKLKKNEKRNEIKPKNNKTRDYYLYL